MSSQLRLKLASFLLPPKKTKTTKTKTNRKRRRRRKELKAK